MEENKLEIIDAEVSEEVIEVNPKDDGVKIPTFNEVVYSDEEIDAICGKMKEEIIKNDLHVDDVILKKAKTIARNSKDYLDNDTYLWVFYAYALKYEEEENPNAKRYCFVRMRSVLDAMKHKRTQQKALTFIDSDINDEMEQAIYDNTAFMDKEKRMMYKQFLKMQTMIMAIFVLVVKMLLHYSWIMTLVLCVFLFLINNFVTFRSLCTRYEKNQTEASKAFCKDEELKDFDLPVYNS